MRRLLLGLLLLHMPAVWADGLTSGPTQLSAADSNGFGQLIKPDDDTILHFFRTGPSDIASGVIQRTAFTISTRTWGATTTVYTDPDAAIDLRSATGCAIGSKIYLFAARYRFATAVFQDIGFIASTDLTGTSFGSFTVTFTGAGERFNANPGGCVPTATAGTYLMPFYQHTAGATWREKVFQTTNSGTTWPTIITTQAPATAKYGEWAVTYINGGRLLGLIRENDGARVYQTTSTDNGATWSPAVITNLGQTTRVKIPYVYYDSERDVLIALFMDRGDNKVKIAITDPDTVFSNPTAWPAQTAIDSLSGGWFGYPSIEKLDDDEYLIVETKLASGNTDIWWMTYQTTISGDNAGESCGNDVCDTGETVAGCPEDCSGGGGAGAGGGGGGLGGAGGGVDGLTFEGVSYGGTPD